MVLPQFDQRALQLKIPLEQSSQTTDPTIHSWSQDTDVVNVISQLEDCNTNITSLLESNGCRRASKFVIELIIDTYFRNSLALSSLNITIYPGFPCLVRGAMLNPVTKSCTNDAHIQGQPSNGWIMSMNKTSSLGGTFRGRATSRPKIKSDFLKQGPVRSSGSFFAEVSVTAACSRRRVLVFALTFESLQSTERNSAKS